MEHLKTLNLNVANDDENLENTDANRPIKTSSSTNIPGLSMSRARIFQNFRLV